MKDKHIEKAIGWRAFLKTVGITTLGIGVSTLSGTGSILRSARAQPPGNYGSCRMVVSPKKRDARPKKLKKVPFYSHIPTNQIELYQGYINRAFELSPTLEFEKHHHLFNSLLAEAGSRDSLSELDLELIRLQYVCADKSRREKYRSNWVEKVINRQESDFFPDPWAIVSAVFAKDELNT